MATDDRDGLHDQNIRKRKPSSFVPPQQEGAAPVIRRFSHLEQRNSIQYGPARRMSYASRSSASGQSFAFGNVKQHTRLANTYRLGPTVDEKFNSAMAGKLMTSMLQSYLKGEKYDSMLCISLCKNLADVIKERMKDQGFSQRYKYVCIVTLGEKKGQGVVNCSRCLWDTQVDNYATASFSKGNLFAVATLYAIYFD